MIIHDRSLKRVINVKNIRKLDDDLAVTWLFQAFQSGVKISIRKQKPIEETTVQAVEPIIQHHGPWERAFEFENGSGRFDDFDEEDLNGTMGLKILLSLCCVPKDHDFII